MDKIQSDLGPRSIKSVLGHLGFFCPFSSPTCDCSPFSVVVLCVCVYTRILFGNESVFLMNKLIVL